MTNGRGSRMKMKTSAGRLTIPTDLDVVPQTLELMERWGADAIRDCDGTEFPQALRKTGAKVYATYYTTRKDNEWAKNNPDEIQQIYVMSPFAYAEEETLRISLRQGIYRDMLRVNPQEHERWWEVMDRTTGQVVPPEDWRYEEESESVILGNARPYHGYTVSFLAFILWDPVHMYNSLVNGWKDVPPQMTFDVRQRKTRAFSMDRLRGFLRSNPHVDVVRFTTFFHQFTLLFDELGREKYVDWYGYSASVSPYILRQFEREAGYAFRPEMIVDQGYYNGQYRVPSKEFLDFMAFQRREVAKLAKEMVDIVHQENREAMMFLGDHWIGTEPFMEEFASIGLDAVVGSVGNGSTLRLISDIQGVRYTEGRLLPYFFPDTFHEGGDPVGEAKANWVAARRALLRKPLDRIGYGGYLKLACDFPEFLEYVRQVADEFRMLYDNVHGMEPFCHKRVAVLNCWGKMRAWGCHMVHHALYQKQNYSYAGIIEALSGMPFDVRFLSFDDLLADEGLLTEIDVILTLGDGDTAHTGGEYWDNPLVAERLRGFVARGGGLIGAGEPTGHQRQGRYLQLADVLGVEKETGFTLGYDKYNWDQQPHFVTEECGGSIDFGEGKKGIYALEGTSVLYQRDKEVQLAARSYGKGRAVYLSGLPYTPENNRLLHRAILWSAHGEDSLKRWFSDNIHIEVHAYVKNGKYCAVNNTDVPQATTLYLGNGEAFALTLGGNEIRWFDMAL